MKRARLKVARIGNSRGVRIPAATLERYQIGSEVVMEERSDGILLRPVGSSPPRLGWSETAAQMAEAAEDWGDWDTAAADGIETIPWDDIPAKRVAERKAQYRERARPARRKPR